VQATVCVDGSGREACAIIAIGNSSVSFCRFFSIEFACAKHAQNVQAAATAGNIGSRIVHLFIVQFVFIAAIDAEVQVSRSNLMIFVYLWLLNRCSPYEGQVERRSTAATRRGPQGDQRSETRCSCSSQQALRFARRFVISLMYDSKTDVGNGTRVGRASEEEARGGAREAPTRKRL
jgi:hypothetical protein